jgi:uncharacterized membrane protein
MNESPDDSTFRALHRLVEHYTPDGTLGRGLLGGTALFFAPLLFLGGSTVLLGGAFPPVMLLGLVALVASVPALLVGIVTLWPVYLSLIGNVESPRAYPEGASKPFEAGSPAATLKRRYAAGDLSREEFERRLGDVMETGRPRHGTDQSRDETDQSHRGSDRPHRETDGDSERRVRRERSKSR